MPDISTKLKKLLGGLNRLEKEAGKFKHGEGMGAYFKAQMCAGMLILENKPLLEEIYKKLAKDNP